MQANSAQLSVEWIERCKSASLLAISDCKSLQELQLVKSMIFGRRGWLTHVIREHGKDMAARKC